MARRRRPGSRASVVDGRAVLIVPIDAVSTADGDAMALRELANWLPVVDDFPASLRPASSSVSVVLDRFAYDLHLSDVGHATDVHTGDVFADAARSGVDVYVVDGVDPRRCPADDLREAAGHERMVGAGVAAFEVDVLSS